MSQWKGPFEELYYKALSDGAQDIAEQAQIILRDAGLSEKKIIKLSKAFQQQVSSVHQRHAYDSSLLNTLPAAPSCAFIPE